MNEVKHREIKDLHKQLELSQDKVYDLTSKYTTLEARNTDLLVQKEHEIQKANLRLKQQVNMLVLNICIRFVFLIMKTSLLWNEGG